MNIRDIMTACPAECTEDAPLSEVYELIQKCDQGFVVVLDSSTHRVPIGVVNEHSICEHIVGRGRNPKGLRAGNVMNSRIRRVFDSSGIDQIGGNVGSEADKPMLVTNEKGKFVGIVDNERLQTACTQQRNQVDADTVFSGLVPTKTPARVEIPAFGWMS
jgi:predicted transcriptional regulator